MAKAEIVADEESSLCVTLKVYDENGTQVVPEELYWALVDGTGAVVNDRSAEEVETPALENPIFLTGDDLALPEGVRSMRELVAVGTYLSPTTGEPARWTGALQFFIEPIIGLPGVEPEEPEA